MRTALDIAMTILALLLTAVLCAVGAAVEGIITLAALVAEGVNRIKNR